MICQILDTGKASAEINMAADASLLRTLQPSSLPVLHLYEWEGECASYGYFINPHTSLDPKGVAKRNLQLVRRPTGGGIIFHLSDFTFSIAIPALHPCYTVNTLQNYAFINRIVANAIEKFTGRDITFFSQCGCGSPKFCMADPVANDVMIDEKKVAGGAIRSTKNGYLLQGSISLAPLSDDYLSDILLDKSLIDKMKSNNFCLSNNATNDISKIRKEFKEIFCNEVLKNV